MLRMIGWKIRKSEEEQRRIRTAGFETSYWDIKYLTYSTRSVSFIDKYTIRNPFFNWVCATLLNATDFRKKFNENLLYVTKEHNHVRLLGREFVD